jgi:sugar lactone lactonase YvrE
MAMGTQSGTNPGKLIGGLVLACLLAASRAQTAVVPLLSPVGLAFDAAGGVYVAESGRHVVDRFDPVTGAFTVVAGNGTQGFAGDGGPATAAELDSPQGLALDAAGNLYIADAHNHRVRMVAATTKVISTVASGFRLPMAVALDGVGDLFVADAADHRVQRVVLASGVISTVAGNGTEGSGGDGGAATEAALDSPGGLALDPGGNLYIADTHNHRVRMVAAGTGLISTLASGLGLPKGISLDTTGDMYVADRQGHTVFKLAGGSLTMLAGTGGEGFAGDGGPAVAALLDGPQAAGVSPAGLVTLADTRNQRVRQVDRSGVIRTLAGVGLESGTVVFTGASVVQYGTGSLTATCHGATGSVVLYDVSGGTPVALGTTALVDGVASFSTAGLAAGGHRLLAAYGGDAGHAAGESGVVSLTVTPAPLIAAAGTIAMVYGAAVPGVTGTLTGVLGQDVGKVSAVFATDATSLSPVGIYPVTARLTGAAAANYAVTATGNVTIGQAGSDTTLGSSALTVTSGTPVTFSAKATSKTQGVPTGRVSFLDGGVTVGALALDGSGAASMPLTLGPGTHAVTAVYGGDANFLGSASAALSEEVVTSVIAAQPDFALNATNGTQTIVGGTSATFGFGVTVTNGSLSGPILLAATGLPNGATASFHPAVIPPGGAVTSFTMTIQTVKPAAISPMQAATFALGVLLFLGLRRRNRVVGLLFGLGLLAGCGDRVTNVGSGGSGKGPVSYPITVTGTSTASSGAVLEHTAVVTLTVQ